MGSTKLLNKYLSGYKLSVIENAKLVLFMDYNQVVISQKSKPIVCLPRIRSNFFACRNKILDHGKQSCALSIVYRESDDITVGSVVNSKDLIIPSYRYISGSLWYKLIGVYQFMVPCSPESAHIVFPACACKCLIDLRVTLNSHQQEFAVPNFHSHFC